MNQFNELVFQQLILDKDFMLWARGKDVPDPEKWNRWKFLHPELTKEFDEAVKLVCDLSFSSAPVSDLEIKRWWKALRERMNKVVVPVKNRSLSVIFGKIAAVLVIPLIFYSVWLSLDQQALQSRVQQMNTQWARQTVSVVAPAGTRTVVDLPDGTKVWLNAGSVLTYPPLFRGQVRQVEIFGEAFFQVRKAPIPFIVQNPGPEIRVYGTSFNVNAYPDEETVTVALTEGKISLLTGGKEHFLKPGQVSSFNKETGHLHIRQEPVDRFICWREGKFIFRDTSLSTILRQLQRQYNVDISLDRPELGNYSYIATFQNENLEQILELLKLSAPITYRYEKGKLNRDGSWQKGKISIFKDHERIVKH
ncbi:MAG: FecR family protein [Mangrovibacterium sp.]